jgi:prevent-host-death family protein
MPRMGRRTVLRGMTEADVCAVLDANDQSRTSHDMPYPSALYVGFAGGRALHVVAAHEPGTATFTVERGWIGDPWGGDRSEAARGFCGRRRRSRGSTAGFANWSVGRYGSEMKTVGLFEAKTHLSELCEQVVHSGDGVVVTRRGKPLVRIEPIERVARGSSVWARRDAFERKHGKVAEELRLPRRSRQTWRDPVA